MVETMGIKLLRRGPLEWQQPPTKFHENLPSGTKDIHTCFIPKASNTLRTILRSSKQVSLVAMVTSQPLCHLCRAVNYMH
jgi:hypothetical protein